MTQPQQDGMNLGTARGQIVIDSSGVQQGIQEAKRQFDNGLQSMGASIQNFGQQVQMLGANLTLLTAPLTAFGATGIRTAASFEDSLTAIQARTGATGEAMEQVRQTALQLGADTKFSAQQVSDAFLQLLTAGLSMEEALAALPQVLSAAAAGSLDLGTSADIVTNVMTSFGLAAQDTTAIVQAMSSAAASSPANMLEIGQAMQQVGGVAQQYGITMEETSAIMAIFAQNGIRGSEAGTQLRSMLRNMTSDADPTQEAWTKLGVSMFDATGNARDLDDVLADMRVSLAGMTEQERIGVLQQLGGAYGQIGLNALLASDGVDAMATTMQSQADVTDVAQTMMGTFNGAMESLRGSIETLQITAFTPFIESLTPMINRLIEIVNSITDWVDANQAVVQPLLRVMAVVGILAPALFFVGTALSAIGGIVGIVGTAIAFLLSPLGLVIAAITAFGIAWATNFGGIQEKVQPVIDRLSTFFSNVATIFKDFGFLEGLKLLFTTFDDGTSIVSDFFQALGLGEDEANILAGAINGLVGAIDTAIDSIRGIWDAFQEGGLINAGTYVMDNIVTPLLDAIKNTDWVAVGTTLMDAIGTALSTLGTWATWVYDNLLLPLVNNVSSAVASVDWLQVGSTILSAIGTVLSTAFDFVVWLVDNVLTPLLSNAATAIENLDWYGFGAGVVNAIGAALTAAFDFVAWIVNSIFNPVTDNAETASGQIDWGTVGTTILNGIGAFLRGVFNFVTWLYENILSPMVLGAADAIAQTDWSAVGDGLMNAIKNALPNIAQWVQDNIITPIRNAAANFNPMDAVNTGASNIGTFFNQVGGAMGFAEGGIVEVVVGERGPERVALPVGSQVSATSNGSGMPSIGTLVIQANSEAQGAAGMRGAMAEWDKIMNERNFQ